MYVDRSPHRSSVDGVLIDNHRAAYEATLHLIAKGHRRIAIITEPLNLLCASDRLDGYRKALNSQGIVQDPEWVHVGGNSRDSAYEIGLRLFSSHARPTAAVVCNNQMTLGLLAALRQLRIACPEEFSVIGFDDCEWSEHVQPSLTMIRQPANGMAQSAAKMLLRRIGDTGENIPAAVILKFELIERLSTAPPPAQE